MKPMRSGPILSTVRCRQHGDILAYVQVLAGSTWVRYLAGMIRRSDGALVEQLGRVELRNYAEPRRMVCPRGHDVAVSRTDLLQSGTIRV